MAFFNHQAGSQTQQIDFRITRMGDSRKLGDDIHTLLQPKIDDFFSIMLQRRHLTTDDDWYKATARRCQDEQGGTALMPIIDVTANLPDHEIKNLLANSGWTLVACTTILAENFRGFHLLVKA